MVESRAPSSGWRDGQGRPWHHQRSIRLQSSLHPSGGPMFQKDLLSNKRILITGGGTGLGKATAQRFLELGAEVYICGRREEALAATAEELSSHTSGKLHFRRCDLRDAAAVAALIAAIWASATL